MRTIKYKNILLAATMTATLSSCGTSFLELDPHQQIDSDKAIQTPADVSTALNGVYYWMGSSSFCGRTLTAIGDVASDNGGNYGYTTHLRSLYTYVFNENDSYVDAVWTVGYKVADHTTRLITAAEKMLPTVSSSDQASIKADLAQAYGLRAYATFAIANLYALPYNEDNLDTPGAVLLYQPVAALENVSRSTVGQTYTYILEQLEAAATYAEEAKLGSGNVFYMNEAAIAALEARVRLYMGDYENAKAYAQKALDLRGGAIVTTETAYAEMFDKTSGSSEDIFVMAKASDDNLSANSINTLYTTYGMTIPEDLKALYAETDIRRSKMTAFRTTSQGKVYYLGGKYMQPITNVPVFRVPELYLIIAECEAKLGNAKASAEALFEVAKRDAAIASADQLPATVEELDAFIVQERRRELYQEGHRLFDARRRGETILVSGNSQRLENGLYLYPIPSSEINAGFGVAQNANWSQYLPVEVKN